MASAMCVVRGAVTDTPANIMDREPVPAPEAQPAKRGPGRPPGSKTRRPEAVAAPLAAPPPPSPPTPPPYVRPTDREIADVTAQCAVILKGSLAAATSFTGDTRWTRIGEIPDPRNSVVDAWVGSVVNLCVQYEVPFDGKLMAWIGVGATSLSAVMLFRALPTDPAPNGGATGKPQPTEGAARAAQ